MVVAGRHPRSQPIAARPRGGIASLKSLVVALWVAAAALIIGVPGSAAAAAPPSNPYCVRIVGGTFDPPGDDVANLNREVIWIRNVCPGSVGIGRWTVSDQGSAHVHAFAKHAVLAGRDYLKLHSGVGLPSGHQRYMGSHDEVWDNDPSERAYLRDATGKLQASWSDFTDRVLIGAGDIADCDRTDDEATADLIEGISGAVFTIGDNVYPRGTLNRFEDCYAPSWGRFFDRTHPTIGNHEWEAPGAGGYFTYFGGRAGPGDRGYYSYDLGGWHVISLDSDCDQVGGCGKGSREEKWLRADLALHPADCTLAMWHHPRYTSGKFESDPSFKVFWADLLDAHAEVVLSGHEHNYERFSPQDAKAHADAAGIVQFVVGTGGESHRPFGVVAPHSQVRNATSFGVLRLTLKSRAYAWKFIPVAGSHFTDSGHARCH